MGQFEIEIVIRKPAGQVFEFLADVRNTPQWYSAVRTARAVDDAPPQLGSTYELVRQLPQGQVSDVVEITEFNRPYAFEFGTKDGSTPFSYRYTLREAAGGTVVHLDGQIEVSGMAKLLGPIATQAFKRGMKDNLGALRKVLESA